MPPQSPLVLTGLEQHALDTCSDLSSKDSRLQAFTCYLALREKICVELLPLISSRQPYINDHTRSHLQRVLRIIEQLLMRHLPNSNSLIDVPEGREVSWVDSIVLLNALVWHDLGNVRGREGHAKEVHALFEAVSGHLYDEQLSRYIKSVAEAHSGANAIGRIIPDSSAVSAFHSESVHLQFLAAILRFADELDESRERISSPTDYKRLDLVPIAQQRYWFFNSVNNSIRIAPQSSRIGAHDCWVEIFSVIPSSQFQHKLFIEDGIERDSLTEYFCRLAKIELERRYCNGYIRKGYHHTGVVGISTSLDSRELDDTGTGSKIFKFELSDTSDFESLLHQDDLAPLHDFIRAAISERGHA